MECPNCGKQIPVDSVFCQNCGHRFESDKTGDDAAAEIISGYRSLEDLKAGNYSVDIGRYIGRGWEIFTGDIGIFIGYYVIVALISISLAVIPFLGGLVSAAISASLHAGYFVVAFKKMKGQSVEFGDFFKGFNYFLPLFLLSLVSGIFIVLGLILLIIPGLYLAVAYSFAMPLIVDRKLDFWEAMEASRKIVTKKWFSIFGLAIVLGLISIGGFLALLVGMLFTGPLVVCAMAAAYEDIFGLEASEY